MSTSINPEHALEPAIARLTRDVTRESLDKPQGAAVARVHLETVQGHLGQGEHAALAAVCSIGAKLARGLERGEALDLDAQRSLLSEIVSQISSIVTSEALAAEVAVRDPGSVVAKAALAAAKAEETTLRISLLDGRRLGELLVKMSMLTSVQVQSALDLQKKHSIMLGEALIALELVTPEMLESLLRLQKQKRTLSRDAWMPMSGIEPLRNDTRKVV